jgi:hypothetical protein
MQVVCQTNKITALPKKIQRFAFTQNDRGVVDLTEGETYEVFGVRRNKQGTFYLVLTNSIHNTLPWWMPAAFFGESQGDTPAIWQTRSWGTFSKDTITSHPAYFDAIDDIEDGTPKGHDVFKAMRA